MGGIITETDENTKEAYIELFVNKKIVRTDLTNLRIYNKSKKIKKIKKNIKLHKKKKKKYLKWVVP